MASQQLPSGERGSRTLVHPERGVSGWGVGAHALASQGFSDSTASLASAATSFFSSSSAPGSTTIKSERGGGWTFGPGSRINDSFNCMTVHEDDDDDGRRSAATKRISYPRQTLLPDFYGDSAVPTLRREPEYIPPSPHTGHLRTLSLAKSDNSFQLVPPAAAKTCSFVITSRDLTDEELAKLHVLKLRYGFVPRPNDRPKRPQLSMAVTTNGIARKPTSPSSHFEYGNREIEHEGTNYQVFGTYTFESKTFEIKIFSPYDPTIPKDKNPTIYSTETDNVADFFIHVTNTRGGGTATVSFSDQPAPLLSVKTQGFVYGYAKSVFR